MHKNAVDCSREEIVQQIKDNEISVHDYLSYIPVGNSVKKLEKWKDQSVTILYLTSRRELNEVRDIKKVLREYGFPEGQLLFRQKNEEYKDIAEKITPDILIEDDCESIGGIKEMTITHIKPDIKEKIKSISIKEFGGIDHLPDKISFLL